MELYFLRHGLAGQHGDPRYKDDSLRPLTKEGRQKMKLAALGMKKLGLSFDAILSSPYLRARQTAEVVAKIYKINNKKIRLTNNLLPPAPIEKLLREIEKLFSKPEKILLVGHEPHLTTMMACLLKSKSLTIDFKKGGLCLIRTSAEPKNAALQWLLTCDQLGLMA